MIYRDIRTIFGRFLDDFWTIFARFRLVWYVGLLKVPSHTLLIDWLRCLRINEQEMLIVGPPTCGCSSEIYGLLRVGLFDDRH